MLRKSEYSRTHSLTGPYMLLIGMTVVLLFLLGSGCKINPDPPNRYALVYGISIYNELYPENDGDGPNLVWTDNDAVDMARLLDNKDYEVRLRINNGTSDLLTSSEVNAFDLKEITAEQFIDDINYYEQNLNSNDLFLFYYSGHGINSYDWNIDITGQEDSLSNDADEFLIFPDYENRNYTLISDNYISNSLNKIDTNKKVVILDSCFSGGFIGQTYDVDRIKNDYSSEDKYKDHILRLAINAYFNSDSSDITPENAIVLSASGEEEGSVEPGYNDTYVQNGFFTEALLQASSKGDDNNDGYISVLEMYKYTRALLPSLLSSYNLTYSGLDYSPHISGGPVDYVLFKAD